MSNPAYPSDPFESFDRDACLWGKTEVDPVSGLPVTRYNLINNSYMLAYMAQIHRLSEVPLLATLRHFRQNQQQDNSQAHGTFKVWTDDATITDRNAGFFIGLNLAVVRVGFPEQLSVEESALLDEIGADLARLFDHEVAERFCVYPNKYLGDLVCAWLLSTWLRRTPSADLVQATQESTHYWLEGGWGWAEHLSDLYTDIMFDQLGAVLSLATTMPAEIRLCFERLRDSLLAIASTFAGGPRVPALRSYAFEHSDVIYPYWGNVRPWKTWDDVIAHRTRHGVRPAFGSLCHSRGQFFQPVEPLGEMKDGARVLAIPCERGTAAHAWITPQARLGSVTRFPIFPEAEHLTWGLAWQSFPVAFANSGEGWGFLRWRTFENGLELAHPAVDRAQKDKSLGSKTNPPLFGITEARQSGSHVIALRFMPTVSTSWDYVADAFDLLGFKPENLVTQDIPDGSQQIQFTSEGQTWTLGHHPLNSGCKAEWSQTPHGDRWGVQWPKAALASGTRIAHLWWIAAGDVPAPQLTPEPMPVPFINTFNGTPGWKIEWHKPDGTAWQLKFDLRRTDALFE